MGSFYNGNTRVLRMRTDGERRLNPFYTRPCPFVRNCRKGKRTCMGEQGDVAISQDISRPRAKIRRFSSASCCKLTNLILFTAIPILSFKREFKFWIWELILIFPHFPPKDLLYLNSFSIFCLFFGGGGGIFEKIRERFSERIFFFFGVEIRAEGS